MSMKVLEREIDSVTYAASQTRTVSLPRNYAYRQISLLLKAVLTRATTAGTSANGCRDCAPAQLVSNIVLRANGRDVIKNIDFEYLHRSNQINWGCRPYISAEDWSGGDDASEITVAIHAVIDLAMFRAIRPIDTLLDSAPLATLELIITFGTGMDTMDQAWQAEAGATVTVVSGALYVASTEQVGVPANTPFMMNKEYSIRKQVSAASTNFQIDLPVSNLYRQFIVRTTSGYLPVHTVLNFPNTIQVQAGTEVFKHRIAHFLQLDNRMERQIENAEELTDAAAINHELDERHLCGYYLLDFVKDGRLTECLDTSKLSDLKLVLNVANPGAGAQLTDFVEVFPTELIRPVIKQPTT